MNGAIVRAWIAGSLITLMAVVAHAQTSETALYEAARASGKAADYAAYLGAYPEGQYAQQARVQLEILAKDIPTISGASPLMLDGAAAPTLYVTYNTPLDIGDAAVDGRSMAQIITGAPLFSPIEGLPDEVWKEKVCSDCHKWTAEALCTQAEVYQGVDTAALTQHPLGGGLKRAMAAWKDAGCPD